MRALRYISIISALIILAVCLFVRRPTYQEFGGQIFHTYYKVKIRTTAPDKTLPDKVLAALREVDAQMSAFRDDSELSRLNRAGQGKTVALSKPLAEVLKTAARINRESNGAFDPTAAPLIDLWGFGPSARQTPPSAQEIADVLSYSRFDSLQFNADFSEVVKLDRRVKLDLSAIAKGYAVDKIASLIEAAGFKDYIVDIGGELRLAGTRTTDGELWRAGIGVPEQDSYANAMVIELSDIALATSGDYRNFVEQGGHRWSHTISPQTGRPAANALASATVLAASCMEADAYATALMSLGEKDGQALAARLNLPVIFFVHDHAGGFQRLTSPAARRLLGFENETD